MKDAANSDTLAHAEPAAELDGATDEGEEANIVELELTPLDDMVGLGP